MNRPPAKVSENHITIRVPLLEHDTAPCNMPDFVLSPVGALYVLLDPCNADQVLCQFGCGFANPSSDSALPASLLCQSPELLCPLPDMREKDCTIMSNLAQCCPEFSTSCSTRHCSSVCLRWPVSDVSTYIHCPRGDVKPNSGQSTLLQYIRPAAA